MATRFIISGVPKTRYIDADILKNELEAAGIIYLGSQYETGDIFIIVTENTPTQQAVEAVLAAHNPGSPENKVKQIAKDWLTSREFRAVFIRALARIIYGSIVETRNAHNALIDELKTLGVPVTQPSLVNRTWNQLIVAIKDRIDSDSIGG